LKLLQDLYHKLSRKKPATEGFPVELPPIDPCEKLFVTAEIGVNWDTLAEAKQMIKEAHWAGANAVKFQAYGKEEMDIVRQTKPQLADRLDKIRLDRNIPAIIGEKNIGKELMNYAKSLGIMWYATPMSVAQIDYLESLDTPMYKIREHDSQNHKMLDKVLSTSKNTIISTTRLPVDTSLLFAPRVIWMFCIPKYPPALHEIVFLPDDSTGTSVFNGAFKGYSNHYPDIAIPFTAACLGAKFIECHVMLDLKEDSVDKAVSIPFYKLRQLVTMMKTLEQILPEEKSGLEEFGVF